MDRSSNGDGGKVGATAAEGLDEAFLVDALETGDDDHFAFLEVFVGDGGVDVVDAGTGVRAGGMESGLASGERDGGDAELEEGHGDEGDGLLLAG